MQDGEADEAEIQTADSRQGDKEVKKEKKTDGQTNLCALFLQGDQLQLERLRIL